MSRFQLIYHPGLPGRAEFIRLFFEATGTKYEDTAIEGSTKLSEFLSSTFPGSENNPGSFAPPILRDNLNDLVISQTSNILLYLASQLPPIDLSRKMIDELDPVSNMDNALSSSVGAYSSFQLYTNQIMLTIMDFVNEVHDTHHPIRVAEVYEKQMGAALLRTKAFKETRIKKYFTHLESILSKTDSGFFFAKASYADLALFQVVDGIRFAFPRTMSGVESNYPSIIQLHNIIKASPLIGSYLGSNRRQPYKYGIFRYYKELDEA